MVIKKKYHVCYGLSRE